METMILFAADDRGVFIPQYFAEAVVRELVTGVTDENWAILEAGPEHEWYWDTWNDVENNAVLTTNGMEYTLWQDGDLWLVSESAEWSDDEGTFIEPDQGE